VTEADRRALAHRIEHEARDFDVPALLDALALLGYPPSRVRFRSHESLSHHGALIEHVKLSPDTRLAEVLVNIGLMSSQGPLPMYFWELLQDQRDENLSEFLWFFDQALLAARFNAQYPERDPGALPDWVATRQLLLLLLRLPSASGVHWLMRGFFPELGVEVRRVTGTRRLQTPDFLIGRAELGTGCTMGGMTTLPAQGVEVLLVCDGEDGQDAAGWIREAQRRLLQCALPVLCEQDPYLFLRVFLVLRRRPDHVRLARDRFMGVNRLFGSQKDERSYEQLMLWSGEIRDALASDHLNFSLPSEQRGVATRKEQDRVYSR
jgi:hypothetical protein